MNRTRRIVSNTLLPFREIVAEYGGSASCDTTSQLSRATCFPVLNSSKCTFHNCKRIFVITLFRAFHLVVRQPRDAGTDTCLLFYIPISFHRIDSQEDANTHKAIRCKYHSKKYLHGGRLNFSDWLLPLAFLILDYGFVCLFFNLPVREGALCAELTSRFRFIELTLGRMPILTRRFGANTFQRSIYTSVEDFCQSDFCLVFLKIVAQSVVWLSVSVVHDRYSHARNYIDLPSNTALFLSTATNTSSSFNTT